jgi:molybdopterin-biosynthesis enzyme MoeA-like protein
MKILVAGGIDPTLDDTTAAEACAAALGRVIVSRGHILISGAYNSFDRIVAQAASEGAEATSYVGDPK